MRTEYSAWLVENRSNGQRYLTFDPIDGTVDWTTNADDACHFSRRVDAEKFAQSEVLELHICSHAWPGLDFREWRCPKCNHDLDSFYTNRECPGCGVKVEAYEKVMSDAYALPAFPEQVEPFYCPRGYDPCRQIGCDCRRKK